MTTAVRKPPAVITKECIKCGKCLQLLNERRGRGYSEGATE